MESHLQQDALALLSGDEAVALAAIDAGVILGAGYPGTPSTEILETFEKLDRRAQWSPNEKVALLGELSRHLQFSEEAWTEALRGNLAEKLHEANFAAFALRSRCASQALKGHGFTDCGKLDNWPL